MSKKKFKSIFEQDPDTAFEPVSENAGSSPVPDDFRHHLTNPKEEALRKPVEDEAHSLERLKRSSGDIDTFYQEQIEKKWGLMDRIRDRHMHKKVTQVRGELFELSSHHRLTMYDLLLQTRVQQAKEYLDSGLITLKAHFRSQVAAFVMVKMEDLTREIKGHQFRFMELMRGKHQYAESIRDIPSLHAHYKQSIFKEEVRYLDFLEKLITRFENSVNEELSLYRR